MLKTKKYLLSTLIAAVFFMMPAVSQVPPMPISQCSCTILVPDVCNNPDCQCRLVVTWIQFAYQHCCLENRLPGTSLTREGIYDCQGKKIANALFISEDFISRNCPHCNNGPA